MAASSVVNSTPEKLGTTELLFRSAQRMGLRPNWVVPDGLFAITCNGQEQYINFACSPLNSHISANLAKNKYLTRRILERHRMPNIPFERAHSHADAYAFLDVHDKIIAKPLHGSGSRDIHIITTDKELEKLDITKYILEKYIVGQELRYLVLNEVVIGVHHSDYGVSVQEGRSHQQISYPPIDWNQALVSSAIQVTRILGLKFAAVDYLVDSSGRAYILEVNTVPDLKWFHEPTSGPAVDVASQFLEAAFTVAEGTVAL